MPARKAPKARSSAASAFAIHPLTPERWPDLERLFGPSGACAGCWCMWFRIPRAEFVAGKGEGNRRALRAYVRAGNVPGLVAYEGEAPVGWVALEPRAAYPRLARSRMLAAVDDAPVWSITCFFVARSHRGRGLMRALVAAAAEHARAHGATLLEAYPVDPMRAIDNGSMYHGALGPLLAEGFTEVARRTPTRPIVRKRLGARRRATPRSRPPR